MRGARSYLRWSPGEPPPVRCPPARAVMLPESIRRFGARAPTCSPEPRARTLGTPPNRRRRQKQRSLSIRSRAPTRPSRSRGTSPLSPRTGRNSLTRATASPRAHRIALHTEREVNETISASTSGGAVMRATRQPAHPIRGGRAVGDPNRYAAADAGESDHPGGCRDGSHAEHRRRDRDRRAGGCPDRAAPASHRIEPATRCGQRLRRRAISRLVLGAGAGGWRGRACARHCTR